MGEPLIWQLVMDRKFWALVSVYRKEFAAREFQVLLDLGICDCGECD